MFCILCIINMEQLKLNVREDIRKENFVKGLKKLKFLRK
jgi:hypothetical protein